jgi:hypothetical protein
MRNVKRTIRASAKNVIADLAPPPQWIEPELCKLVTRIPAGDNWAHEIKFDGFRMHARIVSGGAALLTQRARLDGQISGHRGRDRRAQLPAGVSPTLSGRTRRSVPPLQLSRVTSIDRYAIAIRIDQLEVVVTKELVLSNCVYQQSIFH